MMRAGRGNRLHTGIEIILVHKLSPVTLVPRVVTSNFFKLRLFPQTYFVQDEDDILENVAQKFHRIFTRNDYFKVGCALCILLCDNLLTRTQVSDTCKKFPSVGIAEWFTVHHLKMVDRHVPSLAVLRGEHTESHRSS